MFPHRPVAATLTALIHVLVVCALVRVTASADAPPRPSGLRLVAVMLRDAGEHQASADVLSEMTGQGLACADGSYIGVGITADPRTERIVLVGDNTPASRAGLRPDDIVLNPDIWRHARSEGALLRLLVLREGVTMTMLLRVGTICLG